MNQPSLADHTARHPYLTAVGAWALAFGCSVGWGAFVMPGTTFLPIAGPDGSAIGLALGALVMCLIAFNYHYLINKYPGCGGAYTYTKRCFGYDHGFISAWFLILTYVAIIWANGTALPLIFRTLFGSTFQFGFDYVIAGFHVYFGEILVVILSFLIGALVCLRRSLAMHTQIIMAILLFSGVVICFFGALFGAKEPVAVEPAFSPGNPPFSGTFLIFALAPWAYVGFESISHSAGEAKFNRKRSFLIMVLALATAAVTYAFLALSSSFSFPEGCTSWLDYITHLGNYSGIEGQPAFLAVQSGMGSTGLVFLGIASVCAIFTGIIGNYIGLSRLLRSMSEDNLLSPKIGKLDRHGVPRTAIWIIFGVSFLLPFLGRTAISWIVDVTTVGATIAFAFTSACAFKTGREEKSRRHMVFGILGLIVSLLFALEFLIPNITSIKTLSTESYLILTAWGVLGFAALWFLLRKDSKRRLGRTTIALIVLLGLVIFTSNIWMRQSSNAAVERSVEPIHSAYEKVLEKGATPDSEEFQSVRDTVKAELNRVDNSLSVYTLIHIVSIVLSLLFLFRIYSLMQKRERETEVEKALAEETSRAKTSFLSNMSHEIRTPMNAIIGLDAIALRDPDLTPKTREQLEKIGSSAKHLLGLINDILDMSRIESGRMVLKQEEFSFAEFLEQVNIMIQGQCDSKGLTYDSHSGEVLDYYVGDDMKLKQVLINILGNSVKFTESPGTVSLRAEQIASDPETGLCTLRFTISDTGIGMDKSFLPKLFDSFSQEDMTNTNKYGGSGLGMSITKNFVEMMQGSIEVESEKGVGSTFTVTVCLKGSDRVYEKPVIREAGATGLLEGRRVLMAEDVDANAEILSDLLELEGIESERAENGQKAVELFTTKPEGYFDAILMDVRMPVMDGLTATETIRALSRPDAKTIPIIAMTANVFDEDVERSMQAGMNAHLFKPIEPDKLYAKLTELILKAD